MFIVISIVTDECTRLYYKNTFLWCVWFFFFNSTHYKLYIHIPCIITQRQTTATLHGNRVLSSCYRQTPIMYQESADHCEGDRKWDVIGLLHSSLTIHYSNQLVLAIVPDLNIFV